MLISLQNLLYRQPRLECWLRFMNLGTWIFSTKARCSATFQRRLFHQSQYSTWWIVQINCRHILCFPFLIIRAFEQTVRWEQAAAGISFRIKVLANKLNVKIKLDQFNQVDVSTHQLNRMLETKPSRPDRFPWLATSIHVQLETRNSWLIQLNDKHPTWTGE